MKKIKKLTEAQQELFDKVKLYITLSSPGLQLPCCENCHNGPYRRIKCEYKQTLNFFYIRNQESRGNRDVDFSLSIYPSRTSRDFTTGICQHFFDHETD